MGRVGQRVAMCLAAAGLFLQACGCGGDSWKEVSNKVGNFRVLMPGVPEYTKQTEGTGEGPGIDTHVFLCEVGDSLAYSIDYNDFTYEVVNPFDFLDGMPDQLAQAMEGEVIWEQEVYVGRFYGMDFEIQVVEGILRYRIFLVGKRFYRMLVSVMGEAYVSPEDIEKFFDSFTLLNPQKTFAVPQK